jgi:hypothetical protein
MKGFVSIKSFSFKNIIPFAIAIVALYFTFEYLESQDIFYVEPCNHGKVTTKMLNSGQSSGQDCVQY